MMHLKMCSFWSADRQLCLADLSQANFRAANSAVAGRQHNLGFLQLLSSRVAQSIIDYVPEVPA